MGSGHTHSVQTSTLPAGRTVSMRYLAALPALCLLFLEQVLLQDEVASLPAGSDAVLSSPYVDSFSCEGQAYGYFADVENNCEVFHICYPLTDDTGRPSSAITQRTLSPVRSPPVSTVMSSSDWWRR